jgi:hypothetical protein
MTHVSANVRLRPIRFAFLARPGDRQRVLEIFRINTCLWGGKFNPIIPFFRQVPTWWDRQGHRFETAKQIINGYLDRYEPDFLVEAEKGLADGLGFNTERVLQLTEVLARDGDRDKMGHGLSTFDLYKYLYAKEFQFERRHKHNITSITADARAFEAFTACVFGGFPTQKDLTYFGSAFKDAFDPKEVTLNGAALSVLYKSGLTSALDLGHAKIQVDYNDHSDATLFVLNALESRDLIDFWNLRTLQREVLAVPLQWLGELSDYRRSAIKKAYRPMPHNTHGVMLGARVLFSRSIPSADIQRLHAQHFAVDVPGANARQDWYPSIWRESPRYVVRSSRPTLTADEKTFDVQYSEGNSDVRFDALHPDFAARYGNNNRWANVVKLRDFGFESRIATTFPTDYRDPKFSPFRVGRDVLLATTEGFVIFPMFRDMQHYWTLTDGMSAIARWLKTSNIEVKLSDAGRATQQTIQTLGGFGGVRSVANAVVVKLLNEISRKPVAKSMNQREFINRVTNAVKGNVWLEGAAEKLIARNAVELGLELKCSKCSSWSWYSLKQLDYTVRCSLCLREFGFPIIDPSGADSSRWAYRLIGPFALPDYANGGYAAALAIRFFADIIGRMDVNVTWSSGQELTFPGGKKVEADFILWYRRTEMFGPGHSTEIVFGEAKSFGREGSKNPTNLSRKSMNQDVFKEDDVARMKHLAESFPGAVLVFATMKDGNELTKDEVDRLRRLAEWGREYVRESRRTRAPVIVLTGTELFSGYSVEDVWEQKGGEHKALVTRGHVQLDHLKTLADLTQQLYLGMSPYHEWIEAKWKARRARRRPAAKSA